MVTVVFVDLVGSTRLSSQIDPERYREVIAAYYRTVTDELESLRGRAFNFAGDAVVGVFGIPTSHDDDALRGVRAGLGLTARIGRVGEELGVPAPLLVRVGIATGPVAIGSEPSEQGLLFGATVNLAARIQQAAEPGTVLVDDTSHLLTLAQVEYGEPREVEAKGFEDTARAWPVVSLAPGSARRTIPLVGRKRELRLLVDTFEGARETKRGHLATLLGEPGIGKSRVAEEFLDGVPEGTTVLVGRANQFEEDVTFAPVAQVLLQQLGEREDAPAEHLLARLEELVLDCCPREEIPQVVSRLATALGIGDDKPDHGRRYRVAEVRSGLLALLEGLSRDGAVVLVFEDLHLAQPSMLDLVEQVVRDAKRIPLLVLAVARYDLLDARPDWGGGLGDSITLYLEAMSLDDATELALEAGEGIDEATAERVARHAGGNPFFIVETTGMLRHTEGHLPSDTAPLPKQLLPPTVQAVIASRIDRLPAEAKDLVRKASVFARSIFDLSELSIITEPNEKVLSLLEDEELILRDEERADRWRFRHGLVRDVAYESLPKRERQRLHLKVANKLASDAETAARSPRAIAYHLERAARASLDLNPRDRTLAERAMEALAHAGDLALDASDARAAADLYARAIDMAGPERTWGEREAAILASLGEARYWQGEFDGAVPVLERAAELGEGNPAVCAQATRFLGDIELSIRGNRERAAELFATALASARELGDPWTLARTLLVAGWEPFWTDLEAARAMFEEALEVARSNPEGDRWAEARALGALAGVEAEVGDEEVCLALGSQALSIAEGANDPFSVAVGREIVGGALRRMMQLDGAVVHLDRAVDAFRALGARWELASAVTSRGIVHRLSARYEEALRDLREAYRLCRDLKERSLITWTASALARALTETGELGEARRVLTDAAPFVGPDGPAPGDWLMDAELEILYADGDRETALERARRILDRELERGWTKDAAGMVWWIARVFGADAAGGDEDVQRARKHLDSHHSVQMVREPDLFLERIGS